MGGQSAYLGDVGSFRGPGGDGSRPGEDIHSSSLAVVIPALQAGLDEGEGAVELNIVAIREESIQDTSFCRVGLFEEALCLGRSRVDEVQVDSVDGGDGRDRALELLEQDRPTARSQSGKSGKDEHPQGNQPLLCTTTGTLTLTRRTMNVPVACPSPIEEATNDLEGQREIRV